MKSGDHSIPRDTDSYRKQFAEIRDRNFVQRTVASHPALVAKEPVNGHRMWQDYHGEPYDAAKFDLVEGMWNHDHCSICWFTIKDGYTYWENEKRIKLLCDSCYEALTKV